MEPLYTLDKIKFATDGPTIEKAIDLYESGKVTQFKEDFGHYSAVVLGTKPYRVFVDSRHYDQGDCECYLGQHDQLCKHMVAVAMYAVMQGKPLSDNDKVFVSNAACSGVAGVLNEKELAETKEKITSALRYIKPYVGPSRKWFAYQGSLSEGCNRLAAIVSTLPVSEQTANLLVDLLVRLDKKLCTGGVDDSDGTVGGCMDEIVRVLEQFADLDKNCSKAFKKLAGRQTCFDWHEPLLRL